MKKYIALFRGINVGGNNILPMKELTSLLQTAGFKNVKTYIQSGNVVFDAGEKSKKEISSDISKLISEQFNFKPAVMLLSEVELIEAVEKNPFTPSDGKHLHLYFMEANPEKPDIEKMNSLKAASEEFTLPGNILYLHAPEGIGRSKLAEKAERCLGVPATARNWNTVLKLSEMIKQ